jgi:predicted hotdog family 3-hydroxylacyl-ACP dehydratase
MRSVHVRGVGFFSPGFGGARAFAENRSDPADHAPREAVLPPRARRGISLVTRMLVDVADQAIADAGFDKHTVRTVYASAYGEVETAVALLGMRDAGDGVLSPARFQTSVHNTAGGLLSIAHGNRSASSAIAAGPRTVAMGLLEATALFHEHGDPVVVAFADEPVPDLLQAGPPFAPVAVAFALGDAAEGALACIEELRERAEASSAPPAPGDPALSGNPVAAAVSLLRAVLSARDVSRAVVPLEASASAWCATVSPPRRPQRRLPPIVEIVPHRAPMLLIDEACSYDETGVECVVVLRDDSPFVERGRARATLALEYMAQSISAWFGLRSRDRGEPVRPGYLIGSREVTFAVDHFRVGDELRVRASLVWGDATLGSFDCSVLRAGEVVASGNLSVYSGPDAARAATSAEFSHAGGEPR